MKKIWSVMLVAVLLLSVAVIPTFAQETSVIEEPVLQVLDAVEKDCNIKVVVKLRDYLDEVENAKITMQTNTVCGYTKDEADTRDKLGEWLNTQTSLKNEFYENANQDIVEQMNLCSDELLEYFQTRYTLFVTKERVLEISAINGVVSISLKGGFVKPDAEHLYEEQLYKEYYIESDVYKYDEVYYHRNVNDEIDWALIETVFQYAQPLNVYAVIGDRVWLGDSIWPTVNYCIYDVEQSKFFDICQINWADYDGLEDVILSLELGVPIGDADVDGQLSVLDATYIQRVLAKLIIFPTDDLSSYFRVTPDELNYLSDIDRDGERSIIDATLIQMKLAKLDLPVATPDEV